MSRKRKKKVIDVVADEYGCTCLWIKVPLQIKFWNSISIDHKVGEEVAILEVNNWIIATSAKKFTVSQQD